MEEKEKKEGYELVLAQVAGLIEMEKEVIPTLGNVSSVLRDFLPHTVFSGFYLLKNGELILGPFQGSVSCTRIALGKGVCGESAEKKETVIVDSVKTYPNYISCDSKAESEIVVPLVYDNQLYGVLDLDSDQLSDYNEVDGDYLKQLVELLKDLNW